MIRDGWDWFEHNRHAGAAANKKARRWRATRRRWVRWLRSWAW